MPEPKQTQGQPANNGVLEIAKRMRTAKLMRPNVALQNANGNNQPPEKSPMEQMAEVRERLLAQKAMEVLIDDQEADVDLKRAEVKARVAEARATTIEAEARIEELAGNKRGGDGAITGIVLAMLEKSLNKEPSDGVSPALAQALNAMADSLAGLKQEIVGRQLTGEEPSQDFATRITEMVQMKQALDTLFPSEKPAPVSAVGSSLQEMMMMQKLEYDHRSRLAELDDRRTEREREDQRHLREIEAMNERSEKLSGMFVRALETAAPLIKDFASKTAATPVPSAAAFTYQTEMVPPNVTPMYPPPVQPTGFGYEPIPEAEVAHQPVDLEEVCPHCSSFIKFPQGISEFPCPRCGNAITVEYSPEELASMGGS